MDGTWPGALPNCAGGRQFLKTVGMLGREHTGTCSLMLGLSVSDNSLLSLLMTLNLVGEGGSGCPTKHCLCSVVQPRP